MTEDEDLTELQRLEAERARAIVAADIDALALLTDDDYVHIDISGLQRDKAGFLAGVAPREGGRFERYDLDDDQIRLFGNVAVVNGGFENCFVNAAGEQIVRRGRHTRVYVRRPSGWRNLLHQGTAAPPQA